MDPTSFRPTELTRQRDFLCRLARELLGDAARSEDIVQDAFVLALERPPREERALSTWLAQVVRRLSLNELRRSERSARYERAAARRESQDSHAEAAANLDAQHFVLAAVRALEEPYKTTLWLRYYENLGPTAIAAREGLPVKTVKTRLTRGLERLRVELDRSTCGDRAAWGALLLPLARSLTGGPAAVTASEVLGGMFAMKKLVAVLLVVVAALLTWRVVGSRGPSPSEGARAIATSEPESQRNGVNSEVEPPSGSEREPVVVGYESSDSEEATAGATLLVHAVFERDGRDAADVGITVMPVDDPQRDLHTTRARTDSNGRARFEDCAPGALAVYTDRGGRSEVQLSAGATQELELAIATGVDVTGVVVDGLGRPVPGAEIWLSRVSRYLGDGWLAGDVVARASGDGMFFLPSVGPRQSVGAFAPGFAPALLSDLKEMSWPEDDPQVRLTLVLDREGALLEGRVVDELGAPVPGAWVAFGHAGMDDLPRADGRLGHGPTPRAMATDELGLFRADWLAPGPTPVFVLADGFALARVDAAATSPGGAPIVITLSHGATIAGAVRNSALQPVPGVEVSVLQADGLLACPFQLPKTASSAEGTFELECVPTGEVTLSARSRSDPRLRARATRTIAEGATESWDLMLETVPSITGRAVDAAGRGLAGWTLYAGAGSVGMSSETDDEGRFVLVVRDAAEAWRLELRRAGVVHDRKENVHAGDVVELVSRGLEELGRVEGTFVDAAHRVSDGERVFARLVYEASPGWPSVDLAGGGFLFESASPGRCRVRVQTADRLLAQSEAFDLAPGASFDVGLLSSQPSSSLAVEFLAPAGVALPDGCAYVSIEGEEARLLVRTGDEWRADDVDPGRGYLATYFPGLAMEHRTFDMEAGRETRLNVTLERGVKRTLVLVPPTGTTCPEADLRVRGRTSEFTWPLHGGNELAATLTLAPGTYEIEITTPVGLSARGMLEIADLSLEHDRVVFDLH